ncbi:Os02g0580983 [Oryza sativa Japonica Group]|uniref:Os02g0580983 protein n=1 Tax=Oryza sativa subsp. japonica TaxID=39947 RepID=A0A0P0VKW4_ORYSJ|nr:hypothetical protein EE612_012018 [Oryza sativa]BAS79423.1 Os02g0580983 [Oryza sativa Japonica Group]
MMATWPGLDSVGGRAWLTPHLPFSSITPRRNGALYLPRSSGSKNLSALSPSAARRTRRLAGGAEKRGGSGAMPWTMGDLK